MIARPFRLAFIGGGSNSAIGRVHHIAAEMDRRWKVVGGYYSRTEAVNEETACRYGTKPYDGIMEVLQDPDVDAVGIITPTPCHRLQAAMALAHYKAVICEKALATTLEEAEEVIEYLNETKGFLAVTYTYSGYPMVREMRTMILGGQIGTITHIIAEMPQEGFALQSDSAKPQAWRLKDGKIPVVYLDLGVHLHHLIALLTNLRPLAATGSEMRYGKYDVIDTVMATVDYEKGVKAMLMFGKASLGERNGLRVRVFGTLGSLEWVQESPEYLWHSTSHGKRERLDRASPDIHVADYASTSRFKVGHPSGYIEAFANIYQDIATALQSTVRGPQFMSAGVATEGLALMEAITTSAKKKRTCLVEYWPDD